MLLHTIGLATPAYAQWLKYPTPGIPRTADGKPNLTAPAPRTSDGKPDFSGVWGFDGGPSMFYLPVGLKPSEIKPFVNDLLKERGENFGAGDQQVRCLPEGPRFNHFPALPRKIVQTPSLIVVLSEDLTFRQIFLDGRSLPDNPDPSFMGYSIGRWEGDALIVETIGFKDRTWLDFAGMPHSESLRITERIRRTRFGRLEIEQTVSDPEVFTRPFTVNGRPSCTPAHEAILRADGSYPSGHSALGYGWGLILAEAIPGRAAELVARGRSFGDSRRICNVHWLSDIEEGRIVATAVVARHNAEPAFQADLAAARA